MRAARLGQTAPSGLPQGEAVHRFFLEGLAKAGLRLTETVRPTRGAGVGPALRLTAILAAAVGDEDMGFVVADQATRCAGTTRASSLPCSRSISLRS